MSLKTRIEAYKYNRNKRKQEKNLEKFNHRQEELDAKYKSEKQKSDFKSLLARLKFETYTKRLVGIVVFVALLDLQLSYVLAFLGKEQIAETLSIQICVTLLGTIMVYVIRAHFDTRASKRNELIREGYIVPKDSTVISTEVLKSKIQEILSESGVSEHIDIDDVMSSIETENPDDSGFYK